MPIADHIYSTIQRPTYVVTINGVPIVPTDPTSLDGVPLIISLRGQEHLDSPVPIVDIEVNRIPRAWMRRGMLVTIDAGYSNEHVRIFTGGILALGNEDPEFLRTQCFVRGFKSEDGTVIEESASVINTLPIWPAIPTDQNIDFAVDNHLAWDSAKAAEIAVWELQKQARIPRKPTGSIVSETIRCAGDLYGAFRSYQIPGRDVSGVDVAAAIAQVLADSGVSSVDVSGVPAYTLAPAGAILSRSPGAQQLEKLLQLVRCKVLQLGSGLVVPQVITELPSSTAAFVYKNTDQAYARIVDATDEIRVPFNPLARVGQTHELELDYLGVTGRWYLRGHRWEISLNGAFSYFDYDGGADFGVSIGVDPRADFVYTVEREVIGTAVIAVVTFDGTLSSDLDGDADDLTYTYSDNQSPQIATGTDPVLTIAVDPGDIVDPWDVSLTVEDPDGLTNTITQTVDIAPTASAVTIPAIFSAQDAHASATADGGENWNDSVYAGASAVTAKRPDAVHAGIGWFGAIDGSIRKTVDFAQSLSTVLAPDAANGTIRHLWPDLNDGRRVWACCSSGRLLRSDDDGDTWSVFKSFTASGAAPDVAFKTGTYAGDGAGARSIAGIGFAPLVVIVRDISTTPTTSRQARVRCVAMGTARGLTDTALRNDITSLDADGFSVAAGANFNTNESGKTYAWLAFGGAGVKIGSYTGTGASLAVSGVGFTPAMVWVWGGATGSAAHFKIPGLPSGSIEFDNISFSAQGIKTIDGDGFTVGTAGDVNAVGSPFFYVAFQEAPNWASGLYTGNGADNRNLPASPMAFNPEYVHVRVYSQGAPSRFRTTSMGAGDISFNYRDDPVETNMIQSLTATAGQFQVGSNVAVNWSGESFAWFAFADASTIPGGGDGYQLNRIATPQNGGVWVFGGRGDLPNTLIQFDHDLDTVFNVIGIGGELLADLAGASSAVTIIEAAGGVGSQLAIIFKGGALPGGVSIFWTPDVFNPAAWKRCTGLDAGLSDGRYIVPSFQPNEFKAAFGDRNVWRIDTSSGTPVATKIPDVRPAGSTPNHCVYLGGWVGGISGVYLEALENAGDTLGIYKSTDDLATLLPLRPATGFDPWPAGDACKQLGIGAPIGSAAGGALRAALVKNSGGATTFDVSYLAGLHWTTVALPAQINNTRPRIFCPTRDNWIVCDTEGFAAETNEVSKATRTVDGGDTWLDSAIGDENTSGTDPLRGLSNVVRAADGRLWGVRQAGNDSSDPIRCHIYWSDDAGATWTLNAAGTLAPASNRRYAFRLIAHPTNQNIVALITSNKDSSQRVITHITNNRGASWATNQDAVFSIDSANALVGKGFAILSSGRLIGINNEAGFGTPDAACWTSDNDGALWTLRQTIANDEHFVIFAGAGPSKIVLFRPGTAGAAAASFAYESLDQGLTYAAVGPAFPSPATGGSSWSAKYDPTLDALVVFNGNPTGAVANRVVVLSPVSAGGAWRDVTYDLPSLGSPSDCLAVVPA